MGEPELPFFFQKSSRCHSVSRPCPFPVPTHSMKSRSADQQAYDARRSNIGRMEIPPDSVPLLEIPRASYDSPPHPYRWIQLMFVAALNFLGDLQCFSLCPLRTGITRTYNIDHLYVNGIPNVSNLVTIWLIASLPSLMLFGVLLKQIGQKNVLFLGAFLLFLGSLVKTQVDFELGFFLMGLSQPMYQISSVTHSALWHPKSERVTATALLMGSDQLGIGCAFLFAIFVNSAEELGRYMQVLNWISFLLFVAVVAGGVKSYENANGKDYGAHNQDNEEAAFVGGGGAPEKNVSNPLPNQRGFESAVNENARFPGNENNAYDLKRSYYDEIGEIATQASPSNVSCVNNVPHDGYEQRRFGFDDTSSIVGCDGYEEILDFDSKMRGDHSIATMKSRKLQRYEALDAFVDKAKESYNLTLQDAKSAFSKFGFMHSATVFILSSSMIDVLSVNIDIIFVSNGYDTNLASLIGFLFQVVILISSYFAGRYVDRTQKYYMTCKRLLVSSVFSLTVFATLMSDNGEFGESSLGRGGFYIVFLLFVFVLGASLGPLQPVGTEMAVEQVFPLSEAMVLQLFLMLANIFGAILVPIFEFAQTYDAEDGLNVSLYILAFCSAACLLAFQFSEYNAHQITLKRAKQNARYKTSGVPSPNKNLITGRTVVRFNRMRGELVVESVPVIDNKTTINV